MSKQLKVQDRIQGGAKGLSNHRSVLLAGGHSRVLYRTPTPPIGAERTPSSTPPASPERPPRGQLLDYAQFSPPGGSRNNTPPLGSAATLKRRGVWADDARWHNLGGAKRVRPGEESDSSEEGERNRNDFSELYCDSSSGDGSASSFNTGSETSARQPQTARKGITLPERRPTGRKAVQPVPRLDAKDDSSSASGTSEEDTDEDSDDDLAEFIVADDDASEDEGGHYGINFHFDFQPHCMHGPGQDYDPPCPCITQYLPTESDDSSDFSNYC